MDVQASEVFADLPKNRLDTATLKVLLDRAADSGVEAPPDAAMVRCERDNLERGTRSLRRCGRPARFCHRACVVPRGCASVCASGSFMAVNLGSECR